jgi:hypothetical protein
MGTVPGPEINFAGIFYAWSCLLNVVVQVIAFCFVIACVIALRRRPPGCLVGGNLAAWALYVAALAYAIPVCVGLFITCGYWSYSPGRVAESLGSALAILVQSAVLTSPALIAAIAACVGSHYRLRSVPRGPSPATWYGSSGNLLVALIVIPAILFALGLALVI